MTVKALRSTDKQIASRLHTVIDPLYELMLGVIWEINHYIPQKDNMELFPEGQRIHQVKLPEDQLLLQYILHLILFVADLLKVPLLPL